MTCCVMSKVPEVPRADNTADGEAQAESAPVVLVHLEDQLSNEGVVCGVRSPAGGEPRISSTTTPDKEIIPKDQGGGCRFPPVPDSLH